MGRVMTLTVGVSNMKVSDDPEAVLVTYSLGSCIGIAIYDAVVRVGGLLHFMLPESSLDLNKAKKTLVCLRIPAFLSCLRPPINSA